MKIPRLFTVETDMKSVGGSTPLIATLLTQKNNI